MAVYPKGPVPQHQDYAQTGEVPNQHTDFGVRPHNHRDGMSHNDGKHRTPKGLHERKRGVAPGADGFHLPPIQPIHGPFE